jgi:hypothetical protein
VSTRAGQKARRCECVSLVTVRNPDIRPETNKQKLSIIRMWDSLFALGKTLYSHAEITRRKFKPRKHYPIRLRILLRKSQKLLSNFEQSRPSMLRDGYCEEVVSDSQ